MKGALYFEFSGKQAAVFGGGKVGLRRAQTLAGYGCSVKCIALDKKWELPESIEFIQSGYTPEQLSGVDLAVAATSDAEINRKILSDCKIRGIPCCAADDPEGSDFIFPAVLSRGELDIAVTTRGASPMLAKQIVRELRTTYDESYAERVALLKRLRQQVLSTCRDSKEKHERLLAYRDKSIEELRVEVEKLCE